MSKKIRVKAAQPDSRELSVWYNGPDTMRLVPQSAPPQLVEIGGAPVADTTHEFVLRKSRPDAELEKLPRYHGREADPQEGQPRGGVE